MAGSGDVPEISADQSWRLASGDEVIVSKVDGDHVSGSVRPAARSGSGEPRGTAGIAAFEGHRNQFRGAVLIAPVFRVSFLAPVEGEHPTQDPVFQALTQAPSIQVENRRTPHIASATSEVQGNQAEYVAEVAAVDPTQAEQAVKSAVAPHGEAHGFDTKKIR